LEELTHLVARARENSNRKVDQPKHFIRDLKRRLGPAKIDELVAAYQSGQTTSQLMATYNLSKQGVLKLLALT
jgi:hypothetical protein